MTGAARTPDYYSKHKQYCDGYYECASPPHAGKDSRCKEYYNYCGNSWYYDRHDCCPNVIKKLIVMLVVAAAAEGRSYGGG